MTYHQAKYEVERLLQHREIQLRMSCLHEHFKYVHWFCVSVSETFLRITFTVGLYVDGFDVAELEKWLREAVGANKIEIYRTHAADELSVVADVRRPPPLSWRRRRVCKFRE